jgi:AcrR family transcriptional regulator
MRVSNLNRDSVVAAALRIADEEGLERASFRRIAEELGVTPMALYRHVDGKDDLLDGMADRIYAELPVPEAKADWWAELVALARSTRRALLRHPSALTLFARPQPGPHEERLAGALLATLRRAGFNEREAAELHEQLTQMVFALIVPDIGQTRTRARASAFERGLSLLEAGLRARLAGR